MKSKIETMTNILVIVLAVVVGSVFLKDRFFSPASQPHSIKVGDKLANVKGWNWAAHDQTLVLGIKKGCHFCEDSAPFYQRLAAQPQQGGLTGMLGEISPSSPTKSSPTKSSPTKSPP